MSQYTRQQLNNIRIATQAARSAGISTSRFLRQMKQEAHFSDLTSPAGAQGPAQIMPATARGWGVRNVHDAHQAYTAAATHMASYLHQYGGDWSKALTAYNAGPGRVGGPLPAETRNYIQTILGGHDPAVTTSSTAPAKAKTSGVTTHGRAPTLSLGGSTTDTRGAVSAALLDHSSGGSLAQRMVSELASGKYTTTTAPKVTPGRVGKYKLPAGDATSSRPAGPASDTATARANAINAKHLPYLWGGGHAGKVNAFKATPLDCSGAVSAVLGINPRVASQFETWGKPGDGGNRGVTIYAKSTHVLMKINGHFFGTSGSNPGGGAGWIKHSQLPAGYLAGFTVRHG